MKRFLSILLSVMLLLGSLTVTVFAAPTLSLVATNQLAGISSAPFADAGKYVLFNKIDGATYYVNGEEATVANELRIDTPLNKADYVALKVANAGPNVFTAELDEVASNSVSIYGVQTTGGTIETSSTRFTSIDVEAIEDAELKEALSQRENVGYFPSYGTTTGVNGTSISTNPSSSSAGYAYDGNTSTNSKSGINLANMQAYRTSTSVYINDTTLTSDNKSYIGIFDTYVSGHKYTRIYRNDLGIYVNYSSSQSTNYSTGFNASYNAWNDFELVVYEYTLSDGTVVAKPDLYFNNILIAKQIDTKLSGSWGQYVYHDRDTIAGGNVYHTKVNLSNKNDLETIPYYPTLTAVADEENDTVIVTGTDVDEFVASQYTAKVFVNDAPTEDEVVINAEGDTEATSITVPVALTNAKVYVAFVDENNNVLNAFEPVKTAELTYETIAATEMLLPLSLLPVSDSTITSLDGAMVGSKIRFNAATTLDGYTVKYFNNNVEVTPTVVSELEGIIALPVTSASNSYVAKVYQGETYVPGYDSDPVVVTGVDLDSYPSMSAGRVARTAQLTTTTPEAAGIAGINGDNTVSIGTRAGGYGYWSAETVFTNNPNYDEYMLTIDAYVKTADGVLQNADGEAVDSVNLFALKNNNGTASGNGQWLRVTSDGKIMFGGSTGGTSYQTTTNYTAALDAWHTYSFLIHKATGKFDLYVDGVLVAKDFLSRSAADLTGGPSVHPQQANVVYLKRAFTGTLYDTVENIPTEITADLATGEVIVPLVAVPAAYQAETIAVIGKNEDDVTVQTFTFDEDAYETITLGAGYDQIFVWTWDDLVPLCDVIQ